MPKSLQIALFAFAFMPFALLAAEPQSPAEKMDLKEGEVDAASLVKVYEPAPDFTCRSTDGREFQLSALKGKVVLLYFFDKVPGACAIELRYLQKVIVDKLKDRKDFAMLAIGRGFEREAVVKYAGENKLDLPMAADPKADIYGRYFLKFVPRVVVVRKDGTVAFLRSGYREFEGVVELQEVLTRELRLGGE